MSLLGAVARTYRTAIGLGWPFSGITIAAAVEVEQTVMYGVRLGIEELLAREIIAEELAVARAHPTRTYAEALRLAKGRFASGDLCPICGHGNHFGTECREPIPAYMHTDSPEAWPCRCREGVLAYTGRRWVK